MYKPTAILSSLLILVFPSLANADGSTGYRASYEVTFEADWSSSTHPVDFPSNAHWSGLVGGTHGDQTHLWRMGELATPGIESMAETGSKSRLLNEVNQLIDQGQAEFTISGGGIANSPGMVSASFEVSQPFPMVSLTSMIAPSPDWFIGVDSLNLRQDGQWREEIVVDLMPYDAGTDSGENYTSSNQATTPPEPISMITTSPFDNGTPLGRFIFTLVETEGLFPITGHQSGWYYDPERSGEGVNFNVAQQGDRLFISVAWFTYFEGEQFWLFGNVDIDEGQEIAEVEMYSTSGTGFGDAFSADDVIRELWGTVSISHPACGFMMLNWEAGPDFGTGELLLEQLVNVAGLECR